MRSKCQLFCFLYFAILVFVSPNVRQAALTAVFMIGPESMQHVWKKCDGLLKMQSGEVVLPSPLDAFNSIRGLAPDQKYNLSLTNCDANIIPGYHIFSIPNLHSTGGTVYTPDISIGRFTIEDKIEDHKAGQFVKSRKAARSSLFDLNDKNVQSTQELLDFVISYFRQMTQTGCFLGSSCHNKDGGSVVISSIILLSAISFLFGLSVIRKCRKVGIVCYWNTTDQEAVNPVDDSARVSRIHGRSDRNTAKSVGNDREFQDEQSSTGSKPNINQQSGNVTSITMTVPTSVVFNVQLPPHASATALDTRESSYPRSKSASMQNREKSDALKVRESAPNLGTIVGTEASEDKLRSTVQNAKSFAIDRENSRDDDDPTPIIPCAAFQSFPSGTSPKPALIIQNIDSQPMSSSSGATGRKDLSAECIPVTIVSSKTTEGTRGNEGSNEQEDIDEEKGAPNDRGVESTFSTLQGGSLPLVLSEEAKKLGIRKTVSNQSQKFDKASFFFESPLLQKRLRAKKQPNRPSSLEEELRKMEQSSPKKSNAENQDDDGESGDVYYAMHAMDWREVESHASSQKKTFQCVDEDVINEELDTNLRKLRHMNHSNQPGRNSVNTQLRDGSLARASAPKSVDFHRLPSMRDSNANKEAASTGSTSPEKAPPSVSKPVSPSPPGFPNIEVQGRANIQPLSEPSNPSHFTEETNLIRLESSTHELPHPLPTSATATVAIPQNSASRQSVQQTESGFLPTLPQPPRAPTFQPRPPVPRHMLPPSDTSMQPTPVNPHGFVNGITLCNPNVPCPSPPRPSPPRPLGPPGSLSARPIVSVPGPRPYGVPRPPSAPVPRPGVPLAPGSVQMHGCPTPGALPPRPPGARPVQGPTSTGAFPMAPRPRPINPSAHPQNGPMSPRPNASTIIKHDAETNSATSMALNKQKGCNIGHASENTGNPLLPGVLAGLNLCENTDSALLARLDALFSIPKTDDTKENVKSSDALKEQGKSIPLRDSKGSVTRQPLAPLPRGNNEANSTLPTNAKKVTLLDYRRSVVVGVAASKFKGIPHDVIIAALRDMAAHIGLKKHKISLNESQSKKSCDTHVTEDPEKPASDVYSLSIVQVQVMKDLVPLPEDLQMLNQWIKNTIEASNNSITASDAIAGLNDSDALLWKIGSSFPDASLRAAHLEYRENFVIRCEEILAKLILLKKALETIRSSLTLRTIVSEAYQLFVQIQKQSKQECFSLSGLSKLKSTRLPGVPMRNVKGTLLHVLATIMDTKYHDTASFSLHAMSDVQSACKEDWGTTRMDIQQFEKGLVALCQTCNWDSEQSPSEVENEEAYKNALQSITELSSAEMKVVIPSMQHALEYVLTTWKTCSDLMTVVWLEFSFPQPPGNLRLAPIPSFDVFFKELGEFSLVYNNARKDILSVFEAKK